MVVRGVTATRTKSPSSFSVANSALGWENGVFHTVSAFISEALDDGGGEAPRGFLQKFWPMVQISC